MKKLAASDMTLADSRPQGGTPTASPAKRVAVGEEEQRRERALTFKKVGASDMTLAPTWWRRGESNSRPKTLPQELLRAQTVIAGVFLPVPLPDGKPSRRPVR